MADDDQQREPAANRRPGAAAEARAARETKRGGWFLTLFALPFAAGGIGMLLLGVLPALYDWARMQSWQPVPAQVVSASLNTHRGSKSGSTFSVSVHYRYEVGGTTYDGRRAAIHTSADNIGSFQQDLGSRLQRAQQAGVPVQVWFNPSAPAESVADRSLRPGLLAFKLVFVVVFGGVGLGLLLGGRKMRQGEAGKDRRPQAAEAGHPQRELLPDAELHDVCRIEPVVGGLRLYQPCGRLWRHHLVWIVVGAVFLVAGVAMGRSGAPVLFPLAFGGGGGAMLAWGIYAVSNSLRVQLDHQGLQTERRLMGRVLAWRRVPAAEIARMSVQISYTLQSGSRRTTFYRVQVHLRSGKRVTVADSLRGRDVAEQLLTRLADATGYPR